jgi:hypothetical protein
MQRFWSMAVLVSVSVAGCAGPSAERTPPAASPPRAPAASADEAEVASEGHAQTVAEPASAPATAHVELSAEADASGLTRIDAGSIARSEMMAVLSSGIGRFLQKVRAEPHLRAGRFVGWRLVTVLGQGPQANTLRPGDTVMRVNGQPIERPEQFKDVWDSLPSKHELVLHVQRDGAPRELHYRIVD